MATLFVNLPYQKYISNGDWLGLSILFYFLVFLVTSEMLHLQNVVGSNTTVSSHVISFNP